METKNAVTQTPQPKTIREQIGMTDEQFVEMGRIGAVYYEQGNFEKAQTIFEGLVELDPERADARASLGAIYTQTWQNELALEQLNRAIELDSEQIAPYVSRAEVLIRQQRLEEAVADLKRAIELDPNEEDQGANRARAIILGLHEAFEAKQAEGVM